MLLPALARMLGLPSIDREGTATREAETLTSLDIRILQ